MEVFNVKKTCSSILIIVLAICLLPINGLPVTAQGMDKPVEKEIYFTKSEYEILPQQIKKFISDNKGKKLVDSKATVYEFEIIDENKMKIISQKNWGKHWGQLNYI